MSRARQELGRTIAGLGQRRPQGIADRIDVHQLYVDDIRARGDLSLGVEKLSNTGFESAVLPWTLGSGDSATRVNTQADTGSWSCRVEENSGTLASIISERMPTAEGKTVHLRNRIRVASGSGDRRSYQAIRFYDSIGTLLLPTIVETVPVSARNQWRDAFVNAVAPDDTTEMEVEIGVERPTNGSLDAFLDTVSVREGSRIEGAHLLDAVVDKLLVTDRLTVNRVTYEPIGCGLARVTSQSIPSGGVSGTPVQWNSEVFDPDGMHSLVINTHLVNLLEDGFYAALAQVVWGSDADAGFTGMTIFNLAGFGYAYRNTHFTGSAASAGAFMLAGQTISLELFQTSGAAINATASLVVARLVMG